MSSGSLAITRIVNHHDRIGLFQLRMERNLPVLLPQNLYSQERTHLGKINISHNSHLKANKVAISVSKRETLLKSQKVVVQETYSRLPKLLLTIGLVDGKNW